MDYLQLHENVTLISSMAATAALWMLLDGSKAVEGVGARSLRQIGDC